MPYSSKVRNYLKQLQTCIEKGCSTPKTRVPPESNAVGTSERRAEAK